MAQRASVPSNLLKLAAFTFKFKPSFDDKNLSITHMQALASDIKAKHTATFLRSRCGDKHEAERKLSRFADGIDQLFAAHYSQRSSIPRRSRPNICAKDLQMLRDIKRLFPDWVVRAADKNIGTCILPKPTWNQSVLMSLDKTPFFVRVQTPNLPLFIDTQIAAAQSDFRTLHERYPLLIKDWEKAEALLYSKFSNIGSFLGMPKIHKAPRADGLYAVRCVIRHHNSVVRPVANAHGMMWRCIRLQLENLNPERISVIPDVTDLIDRVRTANDRIRDWLSVHPNDFKYVKIMTADMQGMYPSTSTAKVLDALDWAVTQKVWMQEGQLEFMRDALKYESRYSHFRVGDKLVYYQPDGRVIGVSSAGNTCGGTYYCRELVNAFPALESLPHIDFMRYEDDILMVTIDTENEFDRAEIAANPKNNAMSIWLQHVYGLDLTFTVKCADIECAGVEFLDVWLSLDPETQTIRTKSYMKPRNARELSMECSNVPSHTLKGIVIGLSRRYIIINDTELEFKVQRDALYRRLVELGYSWHRIVAMYGKPSYRDRNRFIEQYLENKRRKNNLYLSKYLGSYRMARVKLEYDPRTVIAIKPMFNKVHDNARLLSQRIRAVRRRLLPISMFSTRFILGMSGVERIGHYFLKNGL